MPVTRRSTLENNNRSSSLQKPSPTTSVSPVAVNTPPADPVLPPMATNESSSPGTQQDQRKQRKRSLKWEKDNRPPRPSNAFISFKSSLKSGPLKHEYTTRLARGENIGVVAQQMWMNLSPKDKEEWYKEARRAKEEHAKKYPDYKYQPRKHKHVSKKRRRSPSTEYDDDDDDMSEDDDSVAQTEETSGSVQTVSSGPSESGELNEPKEKRFVEVYMGRSDNLDELYKCGWKVCILPHSSPSSHIAFVDIYLQWALIKDLDESAIDHSIIESQASNPLVHLTPPDRDESGNLLSIDMISMASVMNEAQAGLDVSRANSFYLTLRLIRTRVP